jgi:hypothetical protein
VGKQSTAIDSAEQTSRIRSSLRRPSRWVHDADIELGEGMTNATRRQILVHRIASAKTAPLLLPTSDIAGSSSSDIEH